MNAAELQWIYLPLFVGVGALHALEPGHGKALATAFLVGRHSNIKDAAVLAMATVISHTAVVLLLALAALSLSDWVSEKVLEQSIAALAGLALVGVGMTMIRGAKQGHSHDHGHSHGHDHRHDSKAGAPSDRRSLWVVGLTNGAVPCPGALAALLVAISIGKPELGLAVVFAFGIGVGLVVLGINLMAVLARKKVEAWTPGKAVLRWLPVASGLFVTGLGLAFSGRALLLLTT